MNYQETIEYLFNSAPLFQHVGANAYKEGLSNTHLLDKHFGHPHRQFKTIHVAGTNGKGSCSHTLAAILQAAGYKVGLYTSPHLVDFRERIRINGEMIPEAYVTEFVEKERAFFEPLHPSFFELATALAFKYFQENNIDVAVVEVGLGGRMDCTNIITPDLCIITNISKDHTQFLGDTLDKIASEKAGIIKKGITVIVGETNGLTRPVFTQRAEEVGAPIILADEQNIITDSLPCNNGGIIYQAHLYKELFGELGGLYQIKNTNTILTAVQELGKLGYKLEEKAIREGFAHVCQMTGLTGRWQKLNDSPTLICDTGHNVGGIAYVAEQLQRQHYNKLHIVIGMVNDKDINGVLSILPKEASYYFTKASVKRALNEEELMHIANNHGLTGQCYENVTEAVRQALSHAGKDDLIFVGGSCFIVADLLANRSDLALNL